MNGEMSFVDREICRRKRSGRKIDHQLCAGGGSMSSHLDQSCLGALPVGSASCCCEPMEGEGTENRRGHAIPARSKRFETGEEEEGERGVSHKTAT